MSIKAEELTKRYGKHLPWVIRQADFELKRGETIGIFGPSGSGKSTLGQIIAGIYLPSSGRILLDGQALPKNYRGAARRQIQILFQHPEISFNPRMKLIDSLREPYRFYRMPFDLNAFYQYMEQYGIYPEHMDRFPAELSGGELQRMAIARTMLVEPGYLILDEPTSMLDVVSQAQVILLLKEIQRKQNTGYLFISHDRELCDQFCDRILFLQDGILSTA